MTQTGALLAQTDHRPRPLPKKAWTWKQTWSELLFVHWKVPAEVLRPYVPPELEIQEFDGSAWIGVVPFLLDIRPRYVWLPQAISRFPEINVRTYVEAEGKPGVWFFSLDAHSHLAVKAARALFHLPYFHARISLSRNEEAIHYHSLRSGGANQPEFDATYQPTSSVFLSEPGSVDHWLTERYCLYAHDGTNLLRGEVHHPPWPLQTAEADIRLNSMLVPLGITLPDEEPLLHFVRSIDVVAWMPEVVNTQSAT